MSARTRVLGRRADAYRLLADPTRLGIVDALQAGPKTVGELARTVGVHPNTVRAHLSKLREGGILKEERGSPEGRGRPAKRYCLARPLALSEPEFRLLIDALVAVVRRTAGNGAGGMAEEEGYRLGLELARHRPTSTPREIVSEVTDVLTEMAFEPRVSRMGSAYRIDLRHCPFWGPTVDRHGEVVCSFHLGLIRGMAELSVDNPLTVSLTPLVRPDRCRVDIGPEASRPARAPQRRARRPG